MIPETKPVSIVPYRYPYFQKNAIEKIVKELLATGLIQPRNNPFSSLVVLMRKLDGTWRLCVDHRGLNQVTLKAKFPIPVVKESMDELKGAVILSRLNLRSGYHQIYVKPEDLLKAAFRTRGGTMNFWLCSSG